MPIIYSYPVNDDILDTDLLVGTSTVSVGTKRKNQTKNFSMLDVYDYIVDKFPEPTIPTLQQVTTVGSVTTTSITANSFIKTGGLSTQFLMADGSVTTGGGGATPTLQQVTDAGATTNVPISINDIASATGLSINLTNEANGISVNTNQSFGAGVPIAVVDELSNVIFSVSHTGVLTSLSTYTGLVNASSMVIATPETSVGTYDLLTRNITTGEVEKIASSIFDIPTLQQVTAAGATTTNPITLNTATVASGGLQVLNVGAGIGVYGLSDGKGVYGYSFLEAALYGYAESATGIGVKGYAEDGVGGEFETDASIANIANFKKSGVLLASVGNGGDMTANSFIKTGGTSSQILAADGSTITAGTNITITGGQISSVGGSGGGGSSVNYYLNGGTSQGTFGGTTYYEFSRTAVIGTGADFSRGTNGYIASFITDVADPSLLLIPAGNWNLEFFFSSSSAGGSPSFYAELYKYDGTTFTLIASGSAVPEGITNGTSIDAYFTGLAVPETILTVNDRLAIRVFVNASSKTITLHTQNGHLCEVVTTFTAGLTALNGLQAQVQNFASGTTGTDFDIVSSGSTHTFNLPSASATARGAVTTGTQTFAGAKTFSSVVTIPNGVNATEAVNKGQLDLKANNNEVVKLIVNEFPGTTVTGTLSETLLSTTTIAAGTFPTSCMPDIRIKFSKSGDLGNAVMRLRINTVNNFATATQIGTYAAVAATDTFLISRNPVISSGNMNIFIATSSGQSDTSAVATTESNFAIDVANTIYLFVSVAPGSTTDITTLRAFKIIN